MSDQLNILYDDALKLLRQLTTSRGIQASTIASDNYKRIWARDSVICGIAGILVDDSTIIEGLKTSLLALAKHQNNQGVIPSNVLEKDNDKYAASIWKIENFN